MSSTFFVVLEKFKKIVLAGFETTRLLLSKYQSYDMNEDNFMIFNL